jgi:hypothetical protein
MAKEADYRIKKLEKGPLQRFKNQNLLIKKFGEIGLQIYKAITGKRSTKELRQDLGIDEKLFTEVINYMRDAGMVELDIVGAAPKETKEEELSAPEEPQAVAMQKISSKEEEPTLEELPEEEEPEEEPPPLEEEAAEEFSMDIEPLQPEDFEAPPPEEKPITKTKKKSKRKDTEPDKEPEKPADEIEPFDFEEIKPVEEYDNLEPEAPEEPPEKEEPPPEEFEEEPPEEEIEEPEEISMESIEEEPFDDGSSDLSPVEKIINDKYGDLGLRVYALIDGQRTAEEIMQETGLTETKLVEILDFMDDQGIIKLDYPKGGGAPPPSSSAGPAPPSSATFAQHMSGISPPAAPPPQQQQSTSGGFNPMIEGDDRLDEARAVPSPVELPIKAPLDIVKSVQMKAKVMLKFGDKGNKVLELVDGKNDVIDISLILEMPLFELSQMLTFLMHSGMLIMKPLSRTDVRKKYGDDGYSVYKRYGKEGLMLYELIGKEMTIKQMADMITKDKSQIIDMFVFIHQVLGIELPIDKEVLKRQLGI